MSAILKAHLSLFFANLIYGINYTVAKGVMPFYLSPSSFVLLRVIGACMLFWGTGLFIKGKREVFDRSDYIKLALCGFFGVAANQLLFFEGLSLTSPINASIIMITTPILVLIIAAWLINEKVTKIKLLGIFLGISGASGLILLKQNTGIGINPANTLGDLLIFLNAASYALYLAIAKKLMQKYSTIVVIKWVFLIGMIFIFPVGSKELFEVEWATIPLHIWYAILFVILFTTFLAYLLNNYALQAVSPSIVSAYIYLQPVFATIIALGFGKDELDVLKISAALLIFSGVYLISKPLKQSQRK